MGIFKWATDGNRGIDVAREVLRRAIVDAFRTLLETKHLYQNVSIDIDKILDAAAEAPSPKSLAYDHSTREGRAALIQQAERNTAHLAAARRWIPDRSREARALPVEPKGVVRPMTADQERSAVTNSLPIIFQFPSVKLFCTRCDRIEPFNPVSVEDIYAIEDVSKRFQTQSDSLTGSSQLLTIVLECQGCGAALDPKQQRPQVFTVARSGMKIAIVGRSPIEQVPVPASIPKKEASFYRDALIAFNSGKVLAAIFYMRTFIEQFARRVTGNDGRITGDVLMDAYAETIPMDLRGRMASFKEWYEKLSEPLHAAKEDSAVFDEAQTAIVKHFDVRKVFDISEVASRKDQDNES